MKEIRELAEMLIEERASVAPEAALARFALAVLDALDQYDDVHALPGQAGTRADAIRAAITRNMEARR